MLAEAGIRVRWSTTVADDLGEIQAAIALATHRSHIIVLTGGLGPTPDDVTRDAICRFFNLELVEDKEQRRHVEEIFRSLGKEVPLQSRNQTLVPSETKRIHNPGGTAAGIHVVRDRMHLFALPGVPQEMEQMTRASVIPAIQDAFPDERIHSRTLRLAGTGESKLIEQLGDLSEIVRNVDLAYLPNHGMLDVRITALAEDPDEAEAQIAFAESFVRERAGEHVFGSGDVPLARVIGDILMNRSQQLACAESCTGGRVSNMLTDVPGASGWFRMGCVAYSNEAKQELLGVPMDLIRAYGAVSEEVAAAMADGVRERAGCAWGISTTGIAGPEGGSPEKPVGTVWIATSYKDATTTQLLQLGAGDRERIKLRTTHAVLYFLYRRLIDVHP